MQKNLHKDACLWTIDSEGILWQINTTHQIAVPTVPLRSLHKSSQVRLFNNMWKKWHVDRKGDRFRRKYRRAARDSGVKNDRTLTPSSRFWLSRLSQVMK